MKKTNHKDEDLEFTDSMIERMDEMDRAVYQMCLTLLELENEEDCAKRFPWNRGIVEEIKESAIWILNKNQYRVCYPFIKEEEGNRDFCGLDSCGLSECFRHP